MHELFHAQHGSSGDSHLNTSVRIAMSNLLNHPDVLQKERVNEKAIDMVYGTGAALSKAEPLEALCKARSIMNNLLVQPGCTLNQFSFLITKLR
ncbi:hypothetical protein POUND7_013998 [Theobroma cacao]